MQEIDHATLAQLGENMRLYVDIRFKQLTLLMAAMTAAGAGVAQYPSLRWWLALAGMGFTAVMWVMEVRSTLFSLAVRDAAPQLWPPVRPKIFPWITATLAVLLLHIAFYTSWLWCLRVWCRNCGWFWVGLGVGLLLVTYSVLNYWPYRAYTRSR